MLCLLSLQWYKTGYDLSFSLKLVKWIRNTRVVQRSSSKTKRKHMQKKKKYFWNAPVSIRRKNFVLSIKIKKQLTKKNNVGNSVAYKGNYSWPYQIWDFVTCCLGLVYNYYRLKLVKKRQKNMLQCWMPNNINWTVWLTELSREFEGVVGNFFMEILFAVKSIFPLKYWVIAELHYHNSRLIHPINQIMILLSYLKHTTQ